MGCKPAILHGEVSPNIPYLCHATLPRVFDNSAANTLMLGSNVQPITAGLTVSSSAKLLPPICQRAKLKNWTLHAARVSASGRSASQSLCFRRRLLRAEYLPVTIQSLSAVVNPKESIAPVGGRSQNPVMT